MDTSNLLLESSLKVPSDKLEDFIKFLKDRNVTGLVTQEHYLEFERTINKKPKKIVVHEDRNIQRSKEEGNVRILKSYVEDKGKKTISDWVAYYNDRFRKLSSILLTRPELKRAMSVEHVLKSRPREVALIAMVYSKSTTKNGHTILELEDPTGTIKGIIIKDKKIDVDEIVEDEVIGVIGRLSNNVIFIDEILYPEIPIVKEKKQDDDVYAVFISDTHVGSKDFLENLFNRFIDWLNLKYGSDKHKELASKVKYLFINGDIVDGVGVYPGQEKDISIQSIDKQYAKFKELISKVPDDIKVIITPGNHDSVRIAEPQPAFDKNFSYPLYDLPDNFILSSNPSLINIHSSSSFEGYNVLMYHGYSFDYYVGNVSKFRKHGYINSALLLRSLLRKRHLAPTHGSTLIAPRFVDDLMLDGVPDILTAAHVHAPSHTRYKHVWNVVTSCWQAKTEFQERVGHNPVPGVAYLFSLKNNSFRIMDFRL